MSDLQIIESTLERAARRRRWERAFRGMWQGLFVGAADLACSRSAAYKLLPIPLWALEPPPAVVWHCWPSGRIIMAAGARLR